MASKSTGLCAQAYANRACDTKVERREKLKESRKILAYPYCRPLGEPRRARGDALPSRRRSRAPRFCALRPLRKTSVWLVFIGGFRIRVGPGKKAHLAADE